MAKEVNIRKVAVVGCGFVGSTSAYTLMQSSLFSEMVLIDADKARAEGEALDIKHGLPFAKPMNIYAGDYSDIADAAIIVITAGAAQKPGETRLDLVKKNSAIMKSIIGEIKKQDCQGILLVVSNPVDVLTNVAESSVQEQCLTVQDLNIVSESISRLTAEAFMHLLLVSMETVRLRYGAVRMYLELQLMISAR